MLALRPYNVTQYLNMGRTIWKRALEHMRTATSQMSPKEGEMRNKQWQNMKTSTLKQRTAKEEQPWNGQ